MLYGGFYWNLNNISVVGLTICDIRCINFNESDLLGFL